MMSMMIIVIERYGGGDIGAVDGWIGGRCDY